MTQNTTRLRGDIDEIIRRVKTLDNCRETDIAVIKLQEAIMWLGMANLHFIGKLQGYDAIPRPDSRGAWQYVGDLYYTAAERYSLIKKYEESGWEYIQDETGPTQNAGRLVFRRPKNQD